MIIIGYNCDNNGRQGELDCPPGYEKGTSNRSNVDIYITLPASKLTITRLSENIQLEEQNNNVVSRNMDCRHGHAYPLTGAALTREG